MRSFMDYLQHGFYEASNWDSDNSYSTLTATARSLLYFDTPKGVRLNVSSLPTSNFAASYSLRSVGLIDGSFSYLYTSLPVRYSSHSGMIGLKHLIHGFRQLKDFPDPSERLAPFIKEYGRDKAKHTLLYGRLYVPGSTLEALYIRRLSPTRQLKLQCFSDPSINNGATLLAQLQQDVGKYSMEYLYSTDSALLGVRGLYNFGPDPRQPIPDDIPVEQMHGRFSAGAELYYGLLNKSGGISTGIRFATLPRHLGFPYSMTVTVNPLMGNLSSTYAVKAGPNIALCSQFDFNFYSYESDLKMGCEIWRRQPRLGAEWTEPLLRPGWPRADPDTAGVLKARWDQKWRLAVLWEGRIKELLLSLGVSFDLQRRAQIFNAVGAELSYSS